MAGRIGAANLPTNAALLDAPQTVTGATTFTGGALRLATDTTACSATRAGAVRFTGTTVEICDGTGWLRINHTPSMVAWWRFDEGSGAVANDAFSLTNNGAIGTGATWLTGAACRSGGCLQFDGTVNSYVTIPGAVFDGLGEYTISYWARSTAGKVGTFAFNLIVQGNDNYFLLPGQTETAWSHWVLRRTAAGGVHAYRDGVLADASNGSGSTALPYAATITRGGTLFIAQDQDCPGGCLDANQAFQGVIDDVRVYGYAFSDADIAANLP